MSGIWDSYNDSVECKTQKHTFNTSVCTAPTGESVIDELEKFYTDVKLLPSNWKFSTSLFLWVKLMGKRGKVTLFEKLVWAKEWKGDYSADLGKRI